MKSVLLDTNVLVFALVKNCPQNKAARETIQRLLKNRVEISLCPQVIHESYSILTRYYAVKSSLAADWLEQVLGRKDMELLEPGLAETRLAVELAARKKLTGAGFYDACLAALILNFQLEGICTDNAKDFRRLGIECEPVEEN